MGSGAQVWSANLASALGSMELLQVSSPSFLYIKRTRKLKYPLQEALRDLISILDIHGHGDWGIRLRPCVYTQKVCSTLLLPAVDVWVLT